jgi:aminomethyltransferase
MIADSQLKKVPLHEKHIEMGAKMVPFAGFIMPVRYSSDIEEHNTVRNRVGVFDVSHMGEFMIKGPRALDLIQKLTTNDAAKLVDGKIQYSCLPNDKGGIVDDLLVYRFNEQAYMLVVNASNIEKDWNWIIAQNTEGAEMINISEDICLFAVQGPKAHLALQPLTDVNLAAMEYYTFVTAAFAGVDNIIISATGYTGAGGFEIYMPKEHAIQVWEKIFEAGAPYDIKPIGLGARDTLRLEMGFCLYGNDIDDTTSPLEAGLGWITKFNKEFTNLTYFQQQKQAGLQKKLVAFQMLDRGIPRSHYEIVNAQGENIGVVTSGTQSPSLSKGIGMGYVKPAYSQPDTDIYILIRNKPIQARVVKLPFYKKEADKT